MLSGGSQRVKTIRAAQLRDARPATYNREQNARGRYRVPSLHAPGARVLLLEIDMSSRRQWLFSTVATKVLLGFTGLSLVGFLCVHLAGNLLLIVGPAAFNAYSHALITNPFVIPMELGLLALFVTHVFQAVTNWWADRGARPVAYQVKRGAGGRSRKSVASTTMIWTGSIMFAFVAIHIATMKYGAFYPASIHGEDGRDLYRLVREVFARPGWVGFYVACMAVVGFHLWHGVSSAFESLGLNGPRFTPRAVAAGKVLAVALGSGFFFLPLYLFFLGGRS
jgi:succinate dehydrogenase / fumarate reductase cytochrome b subunit